MEDNMDDNTEKNTCCICGIVIEGYGHNARPFMKGQCCNDCNQIVIMDRLRKATEYKRS